MTDKSSPKTRAGHSAWARKVRRTLLACHEFGEHELVAFERALQWWDRSDAWLVDSEACTGRERAALVKESLDAAQIALRYWKVLKFPPPEGTTRRPGRPSGDMWSARRRDGAAEQRRAALGLRRGT